MVVPFDFNQPEPDPGPCRPGGRSTSGGRSIALNPDIGTHQRHELDRRRRVRRAAGQRAAAPDGRSRVPRVLHLQQGAERQRRLLRRRLGPDRGPGLLLPGQHRPAADYGPSPYDMRHIFSFAANYELPFGKDRKIGSDWSGAKNAILGGWHAQHASSRRTPASPITVYDGAGQSLQAHPLAGAAEPRSATARSTAPASTTPGSTSAASSTRPRASSAIPASASSPARDTGTSTSG